MNYPQQVTIIEVGPRDGLQNESVFVPTEKKVEFINLLSCTGLKNIEVTSFVSPKAIPQLADGVEVYQKIKKEDAIHYSALVPNEQGMQRALEAQVKHIAVFTAASNTFNQRNINCTIAESLERIAPIVVKAKEKNIYVRAYISCVLGCPYEGTITPKQVIEVTKQLLRMKVDEISFGDTIGVGTPKQTFELIKALDNCLPFSQVAMHFHDTYGQALANIYTSLQCGIARFDSSVAGLGGCPYAQGATGNVATEDVLYMMHGLGIETGVDIYKVVAAGEKICTLIGRKNQSKVANALLGNPCS
ncbi:hydroxymethylglutaryl-CoA lyase (plasmid) [Legionella adelaidensis]|uniref:hydroxymethylglutaryl-CoA lyase n=1 Tax=Legionella adelaidensis TaxID=45056 RepID=A0A0W0R3D8_9GAMM|nr:hydroxymethylglutaryl-CoA lyase [Legionella adelaidensis]KTC65573.1 hydroxymethylglutaryl-CoA lyase [Legionella adelaidensis]VEH85741.1 hydroxymethylglutaryl-CoA lyase [Legionella adelaidensis]